MEQDINYSRFRGNLTRKPELKGKDKKYTTLSIACNRNYLNENGKTNADFITVKVWKDAEKLVNELEKGQKVEIEGHTKTGSYENETGEKVYTSEIILDSIKYELVKEKEQYQEMEK